MPKRVDYTNMVKSVDKKSPAGKKLLDITNQLEKSKKAGQKDPLGHLPKHLKVMNSALKDLKGLQKDKKTDKKVAQQVDELCKQLTNDVKMLSTEPKMVKK